jgi:hypothetical protein
MSRIVERDTIVKQGDAKTLWLEANGDLTGAAMTWQARRSPAGLVQMTLPAVFVSYDGRSSLLRVEITPAQTATLGLWLYEVAATVNGLPYHWPDEGFLRLRVVDDLD